MASPLEKLRAAARDKNITEDDIETFVHRVLGGVDGVLFTGFASLLGFGGLPPDQAVEYSNKTYLAGRLTAQRINTHVNRFIEDHTQHLAEQGSLMGIGAGQSCREQSWGAFTGVLETIHQSDAGASEDVHEFHRIGQNGNLLLIPSEPKTPILAGTWRDGQGNKFMGVALPIDFHESRGEFPVQAIRKAVGHLVDDYAAIHTDDDYVPAHNLDKDNLMRGFGPESTVTAPRFSVSPTPETGLKGRIKGILKKI